MHTVRELRQNGTPVCYTIDAGPNVHAICPQEYSSLVKNRLMEVPGVIQVLEAGVGGPARLIPDAKD
jgi:diphosphomevalonate decarboxylase